MNVYPKKYLDEFEVLEEKYVEKKKRDRRARELRKHGYEVKVETINWGWLDGDKAFYLTAIKPREA